MLCNNNSNNNYNNNNIVKYVYEAHCIHSRSFILGECIILGLCRMK